MTYFIPSGHTCILNYYLKVWKYVWQPITILVPQQGPDSAQICNFYVHNSPTSHRGVGGHKYQGRVSTSNKRFPGYLQQVTFSWKVLIVVILDRPRKLLVDMYALPQSSQSYSHLSVCVYQAVQYPAMQNPDVIRDTKRFADQWLLCSYHVLAREKIHGHARPPPRPPGWGESKMFSLLQPFILITESDFERSYY